MKIITISDTHGKHNKLVLPKGDMIIHAGDISGRGFKNEVEDFLEWFSSLDFKYKVFIAGNHDFYFERESVENINQLIPKDIIYLNDSGVTIEGIHLWGSPVQPWFHNWAFNRLKGEDIEKHWNLIPSGTDILITHGPAYQILDLTTNSMSVGCESLKEKIKEIKPKYHIFGHIHEAYGELEEYGVHFINASVLNERYELVNSPIVIEV